MPQPQPSPNRPPIPLTRRVALWLAGVTYRLVLRAEGVALHGLPHVAGLPVILSSGDRQFTRARLATALASIAEHAPGRYARLQQHLMGLFVAHQPRVHGHYSRLTGTCTLDITTLHANEPLETAATLVRAATVAWLWHAGRGRSVDDETAILQLAERSRQLFLARVRRMQAHPA
jgi:hypothetical protein